MEQFKNKTGLSLKCDQETAEVLNSEFQKVFTKTGLLIKELKDLLQNKSGCSDDLKMSISREEIITAIRSIEEGKAPGPDEVSTSFLLGCEQEMLIPLLIIFNKSYDEGKIPEMWRYANVIPVYKKGLKTLALNHRPVSLTCVICKIMEKILKCRLMTELSQKKWLTDVQHGFRSKRSTTTSLLEFYEMVTETMDRGCAIDIFYFDLEKAFDTVPHEQLVAKLKTACSDCRIINWIIDYLSGRKQRVVIRGEKSQWLNVYSGVPQGSVIGPILFLIYINDLPTGIKSKINIFADDTKMASKVDTVEDEEIVNDDLEALQNWTITNGMKFNVDKCSVMHCGRLNRNIDYKLYGQKIRVTESEKDLGVIINNDMKFKDQVASAAKKANKTLGMIKRNFKYVNKEAFEVLYGTLVRPQLEYAVHLWLPYQIGLREKLERTQRRATKLVRNIKHKSYEERLSTLNLMSTLDRRDRGDMIMTYSIIKTPLEISF